MINKKFDCEINVFLDFSFLYGSPTALTAAITNGVKDIPNKKEKNKDSEVNKATSEFIFCVYGLLQL